MFAEKIMDNCMMMVSGMMAMCRKLAYVKN